MQVKLIVPTQRQSLRGPLNKRSDTANIDLINEKSFYLSELQMGTPGDRVGVVLDSGSSDLWVMSKSNQYCETNDGLLDCNEYGTYNPNSSKTYHNNGSTFSIGYLDRTYAKGTWGTEAIQLGGSKLVNVSFGIANDTNSSIGVLGLSFPGLESSSDEYRNIPILMKEQGLILTNAYSLYLASEDSLRGTILFGGIDHKKYIGDLATLDIIPNEQAYNSLRVSLKSVGMTPETNSSNTYDTDNLEVLLDSGTTYSLFRLDVADKIAKTISPEAEYNEDGFFTVNCSLMHLAGTIDFNFGKKTIKVPLAAMIRYTDVNDSNEMICGLTIQNGSDNILGDNFLRSA